jgi:RNA polymerase sigma factor (sigma-70 family)
MILHSIDEQIYTKEELEYIEKRMEEVRSEEYRNEYQLFEDHNRLAKSIANGILFKFKSSCTIKLEKEDVEQEALLALFEAAKKYDQSKGLKFSTYAHYCISGHLYKFVFRKSSTVRLPRMDRLDKDERIKVLNNLIVSSLDYKANSAGDDNEFNASVGDNLGNSDKEMYNTEIKIMLDQILTESEKMIIYKIYYDGKTQNVAADELGLPHTSMNKKHRKIINKIKAIFDTLDLAV